MRILSEHYQRWWLAGILSEFWWIVDLLNVFQRWLAAEHQEGKGTRPPAKAQVSIRNSCDFNCTSYLLIFYFEPSNAEKARADCISRQVLDYWSVLKWHDCIGSKSLSLYPMQMGFSWYFVLNMVRTCATLNVEPLVKFEIYFHVQYIPVFAVGHWQHWCLNSELRWAWRRYCTTP